jgi:hypothetical protein
MLQRAGPFQQEIEQLDGLPAEPDRLPASLEAPSPIVKFKIRECF